MKTVHIKKKLKRTIRYYAKNNFTNKLDYKDNNLKNG